MSVLEYSSSFLALFSFCRKVYIIFSSLLPMHHLAILAKPRKLLTKILSGEKSIESRWYQHQKTPYNSISKDDTIYFKDSGEPVTVKATVAAVKFFADLDEMKIKSILEEYGKRICIPLSSAPTLSGKKYCTLIFLKDVIEIEPFRVDKSGFGLMAAWITVDDIGRIKK